PSDVYGWQLAGSGEIGLADVVRNARPTVLIGVSGEPGAFSEEVVRAMAGYLNGFADPEYIENLPTMNLPFNVVGKHRTFPIKGDSMPPANTGDFVVGKYVESIEEVKDGKTYILITKEEGIVYKRVINKVFKNSGHLELHSDNPQYAPYNVKPKDIFEIWEYVCLLRTKDVKPDEINVDSMINFLRQMKVEVK
ncbi:MAG: malic enzyme-like NAD(P)-binding protein, partial [Bacteroidia bacterium]